MNTKLRKFIAKSRKQLDELEQIIGESKSPCVMIAKNHYQIVLFTTECSGINLNGIGWELGYESNRWDKECFTPFSGTITFKDGQPVKTVKEEEE